MLIVVTRVDAHRYSTIVKRNGSVSCSRIRVHVCLPRDLAHLVVEGSLGLDQGFGAVSRTEPSGVTDNDPGLVVSLRVPAAPVS